MEIRQPDIRDEDHRQEFVKKAVNLIGHDFENPIYCYSTPLENGRRAIELYTVSSKGRIVNITEYMTVIAALSYFTCGKRFCTKLVVNSEVDLVDRLRKALHKTPAALQVLYL